MNPITHQTESVMRDAAFAFGRSTLFARKARASGQAELFESFAYAEALDDLFSDGEISDSDADVRAAIASEAGAVTETYHLFEQQARDVGAMART